MKDYAMEDYALRKQGEILTQNRAKEEQRIVSDPYKNNYTILLNNGIILYPHNRARFSQLCYQRYNKIRKAFGMSNGQQVVVIERS